MSVSYENANELFFEPQLQSSRTLEKNNCLPSSRSRMKNSLREQTPLGNAVFMTK